MSTQPIEDQTSQSFGFQSGDDLGLPEDAMPADPYAAETVVTDMFKVAKHGTPAGAVGFASKQIPAEQRMSTICNPLLRAQSAFIMAQTNYLRDGDLDALLNAQSLIISEMTGAIRLLDPSRLAALQENIIKAATDTLQLLAVL